jgi:hypothetical protein
MAKFVIEIVHPIRFLKEYKTFEGPLVRVGRGFDNDLILGDPHVSPEHLVVRAADEGWMAETVDRENRMYVRKYGKVMDKALVNSGDEITIGRTRLRFFNPTHPVAATKLIVPTRGLLKKMGRPVNAVSLTLVCFLVFMCYVYLTSFDDISLLKLSSGAVGFLFLALLWAGIWAFVGRIIKHKTQFAAQLSLSVLFLAVLLPMMNVSEYLGYFLNSVWVEAVVGMGLLGALFAVFLVWNLGVATNVSLKRRIAVSAAISGVLISISVLLYFAFKDEFNPLPMYYATLKPPFFKIMEDQSVDQFLLKTDAVFDQETRLGK